MKMAIRGLTSLSWKLALAGCVLAFVATRGRELRAAAPKGRYMIDAGTVVDTQLGLTWQQVAPSATYSLAQADTYCESLSLAGSAVWRLPNVRELQTIVDDTASNPAADPAFGDVKSDYLWTSTPVAHAPGYGWALSTASGSTTDVPVDFALRVRCVH